MGFCSLMRKEEGRYKYISPDPPSVKFLEKAKLQNQQWLSCLMLGEWLGVTAERHKGTSGEMEMF